MRISDDKIDEVRNAADIVEVISGYVHLKKRGKNFLGLCPFHTEKTPSFTVSAEKQMYHCFGCGKGGNIFTFIMEMDKVSFVEAVRSLAAKAGIIIPEESKPMTEEQTEFENYYAICRFAGMHFFRNLTETDEGKEALQYFYKRGFTDETIRTFGLGYAMNSWDAFVNKAQEEGFKPEDIAKVGLARLRDDGSMYDYFRGRAIFPILSIQGRVIGFGARKMREDDTVAGKYINSPETPIYNKSRVLYGLFHSKDSIRQEDNVLMVEGYADLISLYQSGIQNVVASSGTALTEDQLKIIKRYSKNLTLVYDSDSAGSSATVRGIDLALEFDLNVRIVELPEGDDPDSFVKKHGGAEFRNRLSNAISFIDFRAKQFQLAGAFATVEGKAQVIHSLVQSIAKINDEVTRNLYIRDISDKYDLYGTSLFQALDKILIQKKGKTRKESIGFSPIEKKELEKDKVDDIIEQNIPQEEKDLLKVFLDGNIDIIQFILSHISLEQLSDSCVHLLIQKTLDMHDEHGFIDAGSMLNNIDDPKLKSIISEITMKRHDLSQLWDKEINEGNPLKIARDAVVKFQQKLLHREMEENDHALKEAKNKGSDTIPYLQKHEKLMQLKNELNSPEYLKVVE